MTSALGAEEIFSKIVYYHIYNLAVLLKLILKAGNFY